MFLTQQNFKKILDSLPKKHLAYILSDAITQKSHALFETLGVENSLKWGLITGFYLAGQIPDDELGDVISKELGINEQIGENYAETIIDTFNSDREQEVPIKPQEIKEEKLNLSEELLSLTKKSEAPEQKALKPEIKPLDTEIMSHFEKPKKELPKMNTLTNQKQHIQPETHITINKQVPSPILTDHPTSPDISRLGSVMPASHTENYSTEQKKLEPQEHVDPAQTETIPQKPIRTPNQPQPEIKKVEVHEISPNNNTYHGQDPYREPIQ